MFDDLLNNLLDSAAAGASAAGELILETVKENGPHIAHAIGEIIKSVLK